MFEELIDWNLKRSCCENYSPLERLAGQITMKNMMASFQTPISWGLPK